MKNCNECIFSHLMKMAHALNIFLLGFLKLKMLVCTLASVPLTVQFVDICGQVVVVLTTGPKVGWSKPDHGQWIFKAINIRDSSTFGG